MSHQKHKLLQLVVSSTEKQGGSERITVWMFNRETRRQWMHHGLNLQRNEETVNASQSECLTEKRGDCERLTVWTFNRETRRQWTHHSLNLQRNEEAVNAAQSAESCCRNIKRWLSFRFVQRLRTNNAMKSQRSSSVWPFTHHICSVADLRSQLHHHQYCLTWTWSISHW